MYRVEFCSCSWLVKVCGPLTYSTFFLNGDNSVIFAWCNQCLRVAPQTELFEKANATFFMLTIEIAWRWVLLCNTFWETTSLLITYIAHNLQITICVTLMSGLNQLFHIHFYVNYSLPFIILYFKFFVTMLLMLTLCEFF